MPPRPSGSLISSLTASDPSNEVVCPLVNHDGSQCRKRCFGDKRFRSMQEHIRRAHPEHYISKLPASAESIRQMVERIPDELPLSQQPGSQQQQQQQQQLQPNHRPEPSSYTNNSLFAPSHLRRGSLLQSANAAAALAQLHASRPEPDWQGHQDSYGDAEHETDFDMNNYFANGVSNDMFADQPSDVGTILPPPFDRSFYGAAPSSTPHLARKFSTNRPRKLSVTENARKGKHERDKSKEMAKRLSHDRKGMSLEPGHKRWEDLLDAAQSATEEESRDLTPIPQSPRSSLPPFAGHTVNANQFGSYTTSPLQNTLLPQDSADSNSPSFHPPSGMEPFPSVESSYDSNAPQPPFQPSHQHQESGDSIHSNMYSNYSSARHHASSTGSNFHMPAEGLTSSSPTMPSQLNNFARPGSSATNATHFPHALHAAALAQASVNQQPQPHNYQSHHPSFSSASVPGAVGGQPTHLQESGASLVEHYCAACKRSTPLVQSYGCTECMCGICRECFEVLTSMDPERGTGCPNCHTHDGKYKPFLLDLR